LAQETVEDFETALEQFREIAWDLGTGAPTDKDQKRKMNFGIAGAPAAAGEAFPTSILSPAVIGRGGCHSSR
jgi:hypothetical protein